MTKVVERWFVAEGHAISFSIEPLRSKGHSIIYTYIDDGRVQILKDEDFNKQVRYCRKVGSEFERLAGKEIALAKECLADSSKVAEVQSQGGRFKNYADISIWHSYYWGPSGKRYSVTKLYFSSEEAARDFKPDPSLGKEVFDQNEWSGYILWKKLVE